MKVLDMRDFALMDMKLKSKQLEKELSLKKEFTYDLRTLYGLRSSGESNELELVKKGQLVER